VLKKKETSQPEVTKAVEMQVRGTWKGAHKFTLNQFGIGPASLNI
jgi:hypothetical protein